jgi:hypothetical protein
MCGVLNMGWTLVDGYVAPLVQDEPSGLFALGGKTLPCVAISCNSCGNTHLLNLLTLGLAAMELNALRQQDNLARLQGQQ